jgi:hypothetical protein
MSRLSVRCLTIAGALAASACARTRRANPAELALAAAASDSLNVAIMDSIGAPASYVASQSGASIESLNACDDHIDSRSWQSFGSRILELELPPGYSGGQSGQYVRWSGPTGSITASSHRGDAHGIWGGALTSECDVYISGAPTHIDLVTSTYSRSVHALIKVQDAPAIGVDAEARTIEGQAQLLHAIRRARVSSAWGRPE